jgi:methyl-accepting chemotaxis protein
MKLGFSQTKIAVRLLFGFGSLMLLVAGISGFAFYANNNSTIAFADVMRIKGNEVLDQRVEKRVEEGRSYLWKFAATADEAAYRRAQDAFGTARQRIQELESRTAAERRVKLAALKESMESYIAMMERLHEIKGRNPNLDTPEAKAFIDSAATTVNKLEQQGEELSEAYRKAAETAEDTVSAMLSETMKVTTILGLLSFLIGSVLSVLISRSIVKPVTAMTDAMGRLAEGNLTIEIPATDHRDEIGDMAKAVQVFKDNAIRIEQLNREQEEAKARAAAERKRMMHEMADNFEAQVMNVVSMVSTSAEEMKMTSQSMSSAASDASSQATTVAAAAEEASMNVQTVATAAEELSASITEISRQVSEAARISEQASEEADRSDRMVQSLAQAAAKIGDVVGLINAIASQTNLLALNATIEAARAGEAGKGFAVVAGEVKSLAHQTGRATDEIRSLIAEVQAETDRSVAAIRNISVVVSQVRDISAAIAAEVEEQGAATQEIARNVEQAAQGTEEVSSNIVGVTQSAATTGAAANQVSSSAGHLAQNSVLLRSAVSEFLTTVRAA